MVVYIFKSFSTIDISQLFIPIWNYRRKSYFRFSASNLWFLKRFQYISICIEHEKRTLISPHTHIQTDVDVLYTDNKKYDIQQEVYLSSRYVFNPENSCSRIYVHLYIRPLKRWNNKALERKSMSKIKNDFQKIFVFIF